MNWLIFWVLSILYIILVLPDAKAWYATRAERKKMRRELREIDELERLYHE